jgi:hypothetical protein
MGNYRRKWWEEDDVEEVPRPRFSKVEDKAFARGKKYARKQILRIVLWCLGGLVIVVALFNLLQGCVIFIPLR